MQQIVEALTNKKCVLFAGSGVTCDAGLPDWNSLVLELCKLLVQGGKLQSEYSSVISSLCHDRKLVTAIDLIMNLTRREDVVQILRKLLVSSKESQTCTAAKALGFTGIVTTNFDHVLDSIVPQHAFRLTNSLEKLKQVSTAVGSHNPFLLRIHGDVDDGLDPSDPLVGQGGPFMVISSGDYAALVQGERRSALILALHSILQDYSVLFLGYSFSDPDVNRILQFLLQHCKFSNRSWYIGLRSDSKLNLPENVDGIFELASWSDLPSWLSTVAKLVTKEKQELRREPAAQAQKQISLTEDERKAFLALSQYLADLQSTDLAEKVLASAMLEEISGMDEFSVDWLAAKIGKLIDVGPALAVALAEAVGIYLKQLGLVESKSGKTLVIIKGAVQILQERALTEWQKDRDKFYNSVGNKLGGKPSHEYALKMDAVLQDLCVNFGQSMAEWVHRGIGRELGWPHVMELVDAQFSSKEDARKAKAVFELVLDHPSEEEIPYLYRLLGASFLANSVRLDPSATTILKTALSSYELFLDSNILLPLVIQEHDDCISMRAIMQESINTGVKLYVIQPMIDEMCHHRDLSTRILNECGGDIIKLNELAEVLGKRTNCFLQGYLNFVRSAKLPVMPWETYLERYSDAKLGELLEQFHVSVITEEEMGPIGKDYHTVLDGIAHEWAKRARGSKRAPILNENEARQFVYIYHRRDLLRKGSTTAQVWFLSFETVLASVFKRNVVKWQMPPTFPFSAWVAFLDSRLPLVSKNPKAIVNAILKGYHSTFDLPDPVALVRRKAFGDRVTTEAEEAATQLALSGFQLVKRVEDARSAVLSRGSRLDDVAESIQARTEAVGEISRALDETISKLRQQVKEMTAKLEASNMKPEQEKLPSSVHLIRGPTFKSKRHRR